MRSLTKEAEQKLLAAIEKAASYVNDGLSPNDAIIKSASESAIPSGHINLMVHAYNTGRTTRQREQGENTLEKAADFPLADAVEVMAALYPAVGKTSAAIQREQAVSTEYALSPAGMIARRKAAQVKAAAAKISLPEKTWTPPPRDEQFAVRKAASDRRAAELAAEELRRQSTVAYSKAAAAMDELAMYFRQPGCVPFGDAVREAEIRIGEHGVSVLNKVAEVYPFMKKQAATREVYFGECPPCTLAQNVVEALADYNAAKAAVPVKQAAAKKEPPVGNTGSILYEAPLTLKSAEKSPAGPGVIPGLGKILGGAGGAMNSFSASNADAATQAKQKAFAGLTDPAHENDLRNIRAQGVLHDMMLNDPVVSGYDPHEVATAFNDLSDVAPQFVDSPATMQTLLRKRLEAGHMADFDIKQLLDMEKVRAETNKAQMETQRLEQGMV